MSCVRRCAPRNETVGRWSPERRVESGERRGEGVEIGAVVKALKVEAPELMGQVLNGAGRCARDRRVGIVSRSV